MVGQKRPTSVSQALQGSYEQCMRGIRMLMERGQSRSNSRQWRLTPNKHELWDMKRFVEEDLGVEFKFDAMINPRIDPSPKPLAVRLTPEEVVDLDLGDPKRMVEWRQFLRKIQRSQKIT